MSSSATNSNTGGDNSNNNNSSSNRSSLVVGLSLPPSQLNQQPNAAIQLREARQDGFDFVTTELPCAEDDNSNIMNVSNPMVRDDVLNLQSKWWSSSIVGIIVRRISTKEGDEERRMMSQLQWAIHMGIPAVLLPEIPSLDSMKGVVSYARTVQSLALQAQAAQVHIWIRVPLEDTAVQAFDTLHRLCDNPSNVGMMLCFPADSDVNLIPTSQNPHINDKIAIAAAKVAQQSVILHKALGNHCKALMFPTHVFLTNKKGYPALSKMNQLLFLEAMRRVGRTLRILIEGPSCHPMASSSSSSGCLSYLQYIHHLRKRPECVNTLDTPLANQELNFLDVLQRPLQPLADHLEFQTYETFEQDPVKYVQYQKALEQAYQAYWEHYMSKKPRMATTNTTCTIVVFVVGAGRGPLMTAALQAFGEFLNKVVNTHPSLYPKLIPYCIEKNPSAMIYLKAMAQGDPLWTKYKVRLVQADARSLTPQMIHQCPANIIVSELLGSFGDNELSPECLQPLLEKQSGLVSTDFCVNIPTTYTAHLAPVSSMRLHAEAKQQGQTMLWDSLTGPSAQQMVGSLAAMETPYVVRSHSATQTHPEQDCWIFQHDASTSTTTSGMMDRNVHLTFQPTVTQGVGYGSGSTMYEERVANLAMATPLENASPVTIHGFLGTFTAQLFGNTYISTAPSRFSQGMFSWFPLYFPLREPLFVPTDATISVSLWRRTHSQQKVWYEWCAQISRQDELLQVTPIHNPMGRSSHVSM